MFSSAPRQDAPPRAPTRSPAFYASGWGSGEPGAPSPTRVDLTPSSVTRCGPKRVSWPQCWTGCTDTASRSTGARRDTDIGAQYISSAVHVGGSPGEAAGDCGIVERCVVKILVTGGAGFIGSH